MNQEDVLSYVNSAHYMPVTLGEMAAALKVEEGELKAHLVALEASGDIARSKRKRYMPAEKAGLYKGRFQGNRRGFGFVVLEDGDLFIPANAIHGAMDRDTVQVRITSTGRVGRDGRNRREGEIVRVLERANSRLVGTVRLEAGHGVLTSDEQKLSGTVMIPRECLHGISDGQKAVVALTSYEPLVGDVVEILGFPDDFGVDVLSIIRKYGFETEFPKPVLEAAEQTPDEISPEDLAGRLDLRDQQIITIDGADAKDLDDAVSVTKTENGWRLGVHIADVSHYVLPHSPLDGEALERGTSVYLVDRVIPMLPVRLSNGICSLHEKVDRLTLSVFMEVDRSGAVTKREFYKSVIRSSARMTYTNVARLLEERPPELMEQYGFLMDMLEEMRTLADILHKRRESGGAIDFNFPEAKIVLDENNRAVDIVLRELNIANHIIEEFMLLCNQTVARALTHRDVPTIYRTHDAPDGDRTAAFHKFVLSLGHKPKESLQAILSEFEGEPEERAVTTMALRSMMKAKYSPIDTGHFGLNAKYYCHFTSPIRRYPDLVCHRALKSMISDNQVAMEGIAKMIQDASVQSSDRELASERAERDTMDLKKAEFMESHIGETFTGVISSVTSFGFFVMLPNTVEGLVRLETIGGDYFVYNERNLTIKGERTGRIFRIGDELKIKVTNASARLRQVDFALDEEAKPRPARKETPSNEASTNQANRPKQEGVSRVFHRRRNRSRH